MNNTLFNVTIVGTRPILIHRFSEQAASDTESKKMKSSMKATPDPRKEAEKAAYIHQGGFLYAPSTYIMGTLIGTGKRHKATGTRRSMKYELPGTVQVSGPDELDPEVLPFLDPETGEKLTQFEVDSRPVTIPATKGKIMRHRAKLNQWMLSFQIRTLDDFIDWKSVHQILSEAGVMTGIGDFRPEKTGPFGQFLVSRFEKVK